MALLAGPPGRFQPPSVASHELVRERLLARITSQKTLGAAQLTLILGPAGFGKTTLLAQAYRRVRAQGDAAVWLECSDLDAEPTHLVDTLYGAGAAAESQVPIELLRELKVLCGNECPEFDWVSIANRPSPDPSILSNRLTVDGPREMHMPDPADPHLAW